MADHNVLSLLDAGLCITVDSDDPTYLGGYLNDNYLALSRDLGMTRDQAVHIALNGFKASFLGEVERAAFAERVTSYAQTD